MKLSTHPSVPDLGERKKFLTARIARLHDINSILIGVEMNTLSNSYPKKPESLDPLKKEISAIITECYKELGI